MKVHAGTPGSYELRVYLDDQLVDMCFVADEEAGYVIVGVPDQRGKLQDRHHFARDHDFRGLLFCQDVLVEVKTGKVRVEKVTYGGT